MMTTVEYAKLHALFDKSALSDDEIAQLIHNWDEMKKQSRFKGLCFYSNRRIPTYYVEYWGRSQKGKLLFLWDTTSDHTEPDFFWVSPEDAVGFIKRALWMGGIRVTVVPVPKGAYDYWGLVE